MASIRFAQTPATSASSSAKKPVVNNAQIDKILRQTLQQREQHNITNALKEVATTAKTAVQGLGKQDLPETARSFFTKFLEGAPHFVSAVNPISIKTSVKASIPTDSIELNILVREAIKATEEKRDRTVAKATQRLDSQIQSQISDVSIIQERVDRLTIELQSEQEVLIEKETALKTNQEQRNEKIASFKTPFEPLLSGLQERLNGIRF